MKIFKSELEMNASREVPDGEKQATHAKGIRARFGQLAAVFAVQAVLLFITADRIDWLWAWVFLGICVVSVAINGSVLLRTSPEMIAERARVKATKDWDRILGGLWSLMIFLAVPLVAGLDERFAWTQGFPPVCNIAGAALLAAGLGLAGWAMIANAFFSTAVRIQTDRGQTVCRTGPYRFVRHPGYVGFILQSVGTPILLGSPWALLPGIAAAVLMTIRTFLEDRMLQAELTGYREYALDVRYRLLPGIW